MFKEASKTSETVLSYSAEAARLVKQAEAECGASNILGTARWFLRQEGRWAESSIRRFATALAQELAGVFEYDRWDPESLAASVLRALENDRPAPSVAPAFKARQHVPVQELRALTAYFRASDNGFSNWVAGYLLISVRLGWRPGEILDAKRDGLKLVAGAEKTTNGRGLAETCERDLSPHGGRWLAELDAWLSDLARFEALYGGRRGLQSALNARLQHACKALGIKRVCTYTLRHQAIADMKASGLTREEIAVVTNHSTNRTATEHYGRKRFGVKRAKRLWVIDSARLALVRAKFRAFRRDPSKRPDAKPDDPSAEEGCRIAMCPTIITHCDP